MGIAAMVSWITSSRFFITTGIYTLHWLHNERYGVSIYQHLHCLLSRLFKRTSKKNNKAPRHWPFQGNPPVAGGFPSRRASNAENVFIWWRHHEFNSSVPMELICWDTMSPEVTILVKCQPRSALNRLIIPLKTVNLIGLISRYPNHLSFGNIPVTLKH